MDVWKENSVDLIVHRDRDYTAPTSELHRALSTVILPVKITDTFHNFSCTREQNFLYFPPTPALAIHPRSAQTSVYSSSFIPQAEPSLILKIPYENKKCKKLTGAVHLHAAAVKTDFVFSFPQKPPPRVVFELIDLHLKPTFTGKTNMFVTVSIFIAGIAIGPKLNKRCPPALALVKVSNTASE
jgi:hypothetical protein